MVTQKHIMEEKAKNKIITRIIDGNKDTNSKEEEKKDDPSQTKYENSKEEEKIDKNGKP